MSLELKPVEERRDNVSKKFLLIALSMTFVFAMSTFALAQDDDADPFSLTGTANGEYPLVLAPDTEYEFAFDVFNDSGSSVAIHKVDITLPTTDYVMGDYDFPPIDADGDEVGGWQDAVFEGGTISWEAFGATSSAEMGDIVEGDMLTFKFMATTDTDENGAATDGFAWVLTGNDAGATFVSGVFYFSGVPPTPGDDDNDDVDSDDDDDDSGGCGC